jgi:uncharacterized membrane protein
MLVEKLVQAPYDPTMSESQDLTDTQKSDQLSNTMLSDSTTDEEGTYSYDSYEYRSLELAGPIPAPAILGQYEKLVPGTAERLIAMAEKEQNHRHQMDRKITDAQINDLRRSRLENNLGQVFGLVIGLSAILAGSYTALKGSQVVGGLIGTAGVAGLVSAFVLGKDGKPLGSDSQE